MGRSGNCVYAIITVDKVFSLGEEMRKSSAIRVLSLLLVLALSLTSCTAAKEGVTEETNVTEARGSSESTEATAVSSGESESSKTGLTEEEKNLVDRYNSYIKDVNDKLIPCDEGDQAAAELKTIPGVKMVGRKSFYEDKEYLLFFEQPLDHNDPSRGSFTQTVYIYYEGKDAPNCFYLDGYDIGYLEMFGHRSDYETDKKIKIYDDVLQRFSIGLKSNYIIPEFRFYGASKPENLTKEDADFWALLNCEQEAEDFHCIVEDLKEILTGSFCIEGCSKGGEATVYQLAKHPEDGDLFIGEAAMILLGNGDKELYEYAYTTAGDLRYGKEKAKELRDLITEFQIECLKNRDKLVPVVAVHSGAEARYSPDLVKNIIFDCLVLDQVYYWQYLIDGYIDQVKDALSMKDADTHVEKEEYYSKLEFALFTGYSDLQYSLYGKSNGLQEWDIYNYNFQSFHEDGHYGYDFSYLRKAIKDSGSDAKLYVTEDMEKDLWDLRIDPAHRELFPYDPSVLEARKEAVRTTTKPLILINGLTDVYNTHEVKESDNENVHIFNIPEACHMEAAPEDLKGEMRKDFDELVKKYMSN